MDNERFQSEVIELLKRLLGAVEFQTEVIAARADKAERAAFKAREVALLGLGQLLELNSKPDAAEAVRSRVVQNAAREAEAWGDESAG